MAIFLPSYLIVRVLGGFCRYCNMSMRIYLETIFNLSIKLLMLGCEFGSMTDWEYSRQNIKIETNKERDNIECEVALHNAIIYGEFQVAESRKTAYIASRGLNKG